MAWLIIILVMLAVLALCFYVSKKDNHVYDPQEDLKEPIVQPYAKPNENGTVLDLTALEKHGYGDLAINAPVVPPYSFFFFIVRYRTLKNTIRFSIAVSRGFEEPRIIKNCGYDDFEDLTKERIEKYVYKFNMFVDDEEFNKLVCRYRQDCIVEIIKKL
jgi:hypothetical protein